MIGFFVFEARLKAFIFTANSPRCWEELFNFIRILCIGDFVVKKNQQPHKDGYLNAIVTVITRNFGYDRSGRF